MKTVTVLKTFQNEGETVRPARGGAEPVRITVSASRARELLKSGLVGDEEDAPEPTNEELRELAMKATRQMVVESGDSHIVVIRTKNAAQGDALRWMLRSVKDEAADRADEDEDESSASAAGVTFSRTRRNPRPVTIESGGGATGADVQEPAAEGAGESGATDGGQAGADEAGAGTEGGERGQEAGDGGTGTTEPAAGGTADAAAGAVTSETAGAAAPPVEPRRPRGNRTGGAAT